MTFLLLAQLVTALNAEERGERSERGEEGLLVGCTSRE